MKTVKQAPKQTTTAADDCKARIEAFHNDECCVMYRGGPCEGGPFEGLAYRDNGTLAVFDSRIWRTINLAESVAWAAGMVAGMNRFSEETYQTGGYFEEWLADIAKAMGTA